jgi:hypothetical protein
MWSIVTLFSQVGLEQRPGLQVMTYLPPFPYFWEVAGVIMAGVHGYMLAAECQRGRAWTVAAIPATAVPAALVTMISFVLTVRLWKGYS